MALLFSLTVIFFLCEQAKLMVEIVPRILHKDRGVKILLSECGKNDGISYTILSALVSYPHYSSIKNQVLLEEILLVVPAKIYLQYL